MDKIEKFLQNKLSLEEAKSLLKELQENGELTQELITQAKINGLLEENDIKNLMKDINFKDYKIAKKPIVYMPILKFAASFVFLFSMIYLISDKYINEEEVTISEQESTKIKDILSVTETKRDIFNTTQKNKEKAPVREKESTKIKDRASSVEIKKHTPKETNSTQINRGKAPVSKKESEQIVSNVKAIRGRTKNSKFISKAKGKSLPFTPNSVLDETNSEKYTYNPENNFKVVTDEALSTFSIDVDNGSYTNARRYLTNGKTPPVSAIRVEEFINYFSYDNIRNNSDEAFADKVQLSQSPWNAENQLLRIAIQAQADVEPVTGRNFVFLVDVSGSMSSANKLSLLKKIFKPFLQNLNEKDRIAIVTYAGSSSVPLESTYVREKQKILNAVNALGAGGSTNGSGGITKAYEIAKNNFIKGGVNRVILASDGDFNVGIRNKKELEKFISEKKKSNVFLTTLGFGAGNYNEQTMESLANKGNGNYYYIDSYKEGLRVFGKNMLQVTQTVAKDVKIQIEFNPTNIYAYRLVGYENRILAKEDFNDDKKDAGEVGLGQSVVALYEIIPNTKNVNKIVDDLRYQNNNKKNNDHSNELLTLKIRYKKPDEEKSRLIRKTLIKQKVAKTERLDNDFIWSVVVASFAQKLKQSEFTKEYSIEEAINLAYKGIGEDNEGLRKEMIQLMKNYESLIKPIK